MPIFTLEQKTAIAAKLVELGLTNATPADASAAMNALVQVANPIATAPTVPTPFKVAQVVAALSQAGCVALRTHQLVNRFIDCINKGSATENLQDFRDFCGGFAKDGSFSGADYTACLTLANATHADPNWTATIFSDESAFQSILPGFRVEHDDGGVSVGLCTPDMIVEVRS